MSIEFTYTNDAGDEVVVNLPSREMRCPTCDGKGRHSLHLGAITEEDRDGDWSPEEFEDYMRGGYDRECETCQGGRYVEVVDEKQLGRDDPALLARWQRHCEDEADYRALCRSEQARGC